MNSTARIPSQEAVAQFVARLLQEGRLPLDQSPLSGDAAASLGLEKADGFLALPRGWDPLAADAIRAGLAARASAWLTALEVRPTIGSTNAELVMRAQQGSITGQVCMAEVQLAGRGRRGRSWFSPLGGNLALTLGFDARRPPAELGGFSLVVGLAVLDALETFGVVGLGLKWPNDVLLNGAKLGGILIELVQRGPAHSVIVGVGLNVRLPESVRGQLDQAVTDLASTGLRLPSRSLLAARLISSIVEFEQGFVDAGFGAFAPIFDARHAYQGADVVVLQGDHSFEGRVAGVALDGGLRISCGAGERVVHGGEVSLRRRGPTRE
jgi:BirA family biotin operon repressor/biotin-[acetyl-CoA-carboxylase] ligase